MNRVFVDANVFMRFFTRDVEAQSKRASRLFRAAAEGRASLVTGPPVLFEVAWTLRSAYKRPREEVLDVLGRILALPGLELTDRPVVEEALRIARQRGGEFADAYIAASLVASGAQEMATFNRKDFKKLGVPLSEF